MAFASLTATIKGIDPRRAIEAAGREGAAVALGEAVRLASGVRVKVRTGRLVRSIEATPNPQGFTLRALAPYASYIEEGTAAIRARRFLADGLAKGIEAARNRLGLALFEVRR